MPRTAVTSQIARWSGIRESTCHYADVMYCRLISNFDSVANNWLIRYTRTI